MAGVHAEDDLRTVLDELAIQRLMIRYATALDFRDWDLLATCFVPTARVTYPSAPVLEDCDAVIDHCQQALQRYEETQHALTNLTVHLDGDRAEATCYLRGEHVIADDRGRRRWTLGGRYEDVLVRTSVGWRIAERRLVRSWELTTPEPGDLVADD